jgi:hypothetical protein
MAGTGYPGPTANLPGTARRSGRAGTVWIDGNMHGEVVSVEWGVEAEQIAVSIPGTWQDESKPGAEARRGTFRYHDLDDRWRLFVWRFFQARKRGDRASATFPKFDIITKLDDIGAPMATRWVLRDCQFFQYDGGHGQDDDLLVRDVPFTFRDDEPLEAFEYGSNGIIVTKAGTA